MFEGGDEQGGLPCGSQKTEKRAGAWGSSAPSTRRRMARGPGHLDLGWSSVVRQVGTRRTGRMEHVDVFYHRGKRRRRFTGHLANKILKAVQEHRTDAAALQWGTRELHS